MNVNKDNKMRCSFFLLIIGVFSSLSISGHQFVHDWHSLMQEHYKHSEDLYKRSINTVLRIDSCNNYEEIGAYFENRDSTTYSLFVITDSSAVTLCFIESYNDSIKSLKENMNIDDEFLFQASNSDSRIILIELLAGNTRSYIEKAMGRISWLITIGDNRLIDKLGGRILINNTPSFVVYKYMESESFSIANTYSLDDLANKNGFEFKFRLDRKRRLHWVSYYSGDELLYSYRFNPSGRLVSFSTFDPTNKSISCTINFKSLGNVRSFVFRDSNKVDGSLYSYRLRNGIIKKRETLR